VAAVECGKCIHLGSIRKGINIKGLSIKSDKFFLI